MTKVFLDSDVVISSLISNLGAAYQLVNNKNIVCFISNISYQELLLVVKKLNIDDKKLKVIVKERLKIVKLSQNLKQIKSEYKNYVKDPNDAHIVAGTVESNADFLITYNVKHYKINEIKVKHNIQIMTPGIFLQFLRSK